MDRYSLPELLCMGYGAFALLKVLEHPDPVKADKRARAELRRLFHAKPYFTISPRRVIVLNLKRGMFIKKTFRN